MSHNRDTDYLSVSTRIHAMETRMLTRERAERMLEAKDSGEAAKILSECGYGELAELNAGGVEQLLAAARGEMFRDMASAVPEPSLVQVFQLKYDYHNAKVLLKVEELCADPGRLLVDGGRYTPKQILEAFQREDLRDFTELFRLAVTQAQECLIASGDPQRSDLILDRACFQEMGQLARDGGGSFLLGYVQLSVDAVNLRTAVRAARMGMGSELLSQALLPGGSVSERVLTAARPEELSERFRSGPLGEAAALGATLTQPDSGPLTAFERMCDDAVAEYLAAARRVPFGAETVIAYLYAKESELTAIRTILSGRMAGLDAETVRGRLRAAYV